MKILIDLSSYNVSTTFLDKLGAFLDDYEAHSEANDEFYSKVEDDMFIFYPENKDE